MGTDGMTDLFLSGVDYESMRALAYFRYMTVAQFIRAGVAKDEKNLRERLTRLQRAGLIARTEKSFDRTQRIGLPCLHFLTQKGAALLNEDEGFAVKAPSRRMTAFDDVAHRVGVVDAHIAFEQWARATRTRVFRVLRYFEGTAGDGKKSPVASTSFAWEAGESWEAGKLIPDLMAVYQRPTDDSPRGLIVEYERGGRWGSPKHFLSKVQTYADAVCAKASETHLRVEKGVRIAVIFSNIDMMRSVINSWPDKKHPLWKVRVFLKVNEMDGGFENNWVSLEGYRVDLF